MVHNLLDHLSNINTLEQKGNFLSSSRNLSLYLPLKAGSSPKVVDDLY